MQKLFLDGPIVSSQSDRCLENVPATHDLNVTCCDMSKPLEIQSYVRQMMFITMSLESDKDIDSRVNAQQIISM